MAKKKRRTGSIITVRKLSGRGVGNLKNPASGLGAVVPPLLGGVLTGGVTILIENMASPTNGTAPSQYMMTLGRYAPFIGVGIGFLGSMALYGMLGSAPAGAAAAAGAVGVGGSLIAYRLLNESKAAAGVTPPAITGLGYGHNNRMSMYGRRGRTGAIVPQLQPQGMAGVGAIVMEPTATRGLGDPRGETVQLGQVSPAAFGTPGFAV